jgi:predicted dehydrogenase
VDTDVAEVAMSEVEAVGIATPDHAHKDPCLAMIEAGKHVLVEKPFTTDVAEARAIIAAAERAGVKLMVDFQLRWHPQYMGAKAAMEAGELGEAVMGYVRLSDTIHVPTEMLAWGGESGPEWFLFPHTMDITRWILGEEPVGVYARGAKRVLKSMGIDAYDAVQALFQFERTFVTFETCWIIPNSWPTVVDNHFTLYGAKGCIELSSAPGVVIASDRYKYPFSSHAITRYGKPFAHFYESIRHFADCVAEDKAPEATGSRRARGDRHDPGDHDVALPGPPGADVGGSGVEGGRHMTEAKELAALVDVLVPGDGEFPMASTVGVQAKLADRLIVLRGEGALVELIEALAASGGPLQGLDEAERMAVVARLERERPDDFLRVRNLTYLAYYESPAVHQVIRSMGFIYNAIPLPQGYAVGRFDPGTDMPHHGRGRFVMTDEVRRVDLARLDFLAGQSGGSDGR